MERRTVLRGLVGLPVGAMAVLSAARPAWADFTTTVNPSANWGTWEGWGTSLAWWANQLGPREDLADVLFSRKTVRFQGQTVPGLGMNVVRYNVGGSGTNSIGGRTMKPGPTLDGFKQIEGYQLDWASADPQSSSWNWNADAHQRDMMWLARDRGADRFELFSNSPMWWMLKNDDPRGAPDGWSCNLRDDIFGRHAAYMATVARYAHDHWGIDFTSVQPVNEPGANWGGYSPDFIGGQEGCHYDRPRLAEIIRQTRTQLDARGLHWMMVAGLDDWGVGSAAYNWHDNPDFDAATRAAVGRVNVHGYDVDGDRDALYKMVAADGKNIWMSEYGDVDTSGLQLARNLNFDLRWLHPTAWVIWQILDWENYGAITLTNGVIGAVNPKYFLLAQYMRHIRPGMTIIDAGHPDAVAAYDSVNHKLVIVAVNYGEGQWINFDLSRFGRPGQDGALVERWATGTDAGGERYQQHADTVMRGTRFWSYFNARTVQTFEVSDVYV
ncbi:glycoside hydrolase [Kitasatospora sp. NPDC001261]|uniref:glycoside hydrolase n=1 Tax=Kitasatospora sp. NPDC001261 TaxID=3364012 RepID=UPI0036A7FA44